MIHRVNNATARKLTILILIGLFVQLGVIGYVYISGKVRDHNLVSSQRAGCERSKLDRLTNAEGWRIAQEARKAEGQLDVAAKYDSIATRLEERGKIKCKEVFP